MELARSGIIQKQNSSKTIGYMWHGMTEKFLKKCMALSLNKNGSELMKILIGLILILIVASVLVYIISIVLYEKEKKAWEDESDADYNMRNSTMCQESIKAGVCPKCCEKCAWGLRKKEGKILRFRERIEKE